MRRALFLILLGALPVAAGAQVIGQNSSPDSGAVTTISVRSQIVTEAVAVHDKDGKPVEGLTASDFTVTEDGIPQKIRYCERQSLPIAEAPLPVRKSSDEKVTVYKELNRSQITPETTDTLHYKDHRLMALYFDFSAMGPADQWRALEAAEKFIRTQMTPADLVSIMRFSSGSVDVLQDFTADRDRLLSILTTLQVGEHQEWATEASDASTSDQGAAFGQDDSEFNIFNTDRQLSALQTASNMLGHLNEKKVLVYFASGLQLNGIDNQAQLHATVDAAIRAGVSFWPIDARGLVAEAPLGNATQGSPGNAGVYSGLAEQAVQADFQKSQDTLYSLAGDTGGKALLDTNDLTRGITQAQRSISDYYVLSYYPTNSALDGKFRRIKVAVNHPADAKLEYRQGYYAGKEFAKFTAADKERQLEDALMLEDPVTDLTIAMELNYFQLNRAEYFVPYVVKIPGHELALAKHRGVDHTLIDFIGEVKDVYGGSTISNVRDNVDIKLTGETEQELARVPIEYDAGFTLLPGTYRFKFLARDDETGRIGTYETTFSIPNLNREEQHVPVSSVVLSSQREPISDALYNAMKSKDQTKEAAVNPLVADGAKLIPSVTRVFHRDRPIYVYLQAYEAGTDQPKPIVAYVSVYRNNVMQLQSPAFAVSPEASPRLKQVPLHFDLDIHSLDPGDYICQVTILDPTSGKSSFWRTPFKVEP
ncbi:VWA domain-containing protein [Silvibacterium sp.]|uniref:VWA domain-containing protein n=1 Tax=Silvibacterium sp. TaxID=1964179 RepID=UPI0039E2C45D